MLIHWMMRTIDLIGEEGAPPFLESVLQISMHDRHEIERIHAGFDERMRLVYPRGRSASSRPSRGVSDRQHGRRNRRSASRVNPPRISNSPPSIHICFVLKRMIFPELVLGMVLAADEGEVADLEIEVVAHRGDDRLRVGQPPPAFERPATIATDTSLVFICFEGRHASLSDQRTRPAPRRFRYPGDSSSGRA